MKILLLVSFLAMLGIAVLLAGCAAPTPTSTPAPIITVTPSPYQTTPAQPVPSSTVQPTLTTTTAPIVWKAVTFLPKNMASIKNIYPIAERVKQRSNGKFVIQYLGGPEVVAGPQQAEAVRRGVVQMSIVPVTYYDGLVPLGNMLTLSELNPVEERSSGAVAFINDLHNKVGLFYLERGTAIQESALFTMILRQPIDKPQQLSTKKIGATSTDVSPFLKAIGAGAAIVPAGDVFSALERGVIDGFSSYPLTNIVDSQLYNAAKYAIDHQYYRGATGVITNLDSWNALTPDLKTLLTNVAKEVIVDYMKEIDSDLAKARKICEDNGMKFFKFSSQDDVNWFYKTLYESAWTENIKTYPDVGPKYRELVTEKN